MAASALPAQFALRWTDPAGNTAEYEVPDSAIVIGRDPAVELRLDDPMVSRRHARLEVGPSHLAIHDLGSSNGTYVNAERVQSAEIGAGDTIRVGHTSLEVLARELTRATVLATGSQEVAVSSMGASIVVPAAKEGGLTERLPEEHVVSATPNHGVVPDEVLRAPVISERELVEGGVDVHTVTCASLGGGMGSFQFADLLRICGLPASEIRVVGNEEVPYGRYQRLCLNSQIPPHERLRSNSDSRPDNPWGFPGYATAEVWRGLTSGRFGLAARLLWSIFGEPALAQTYTPRSGDVFAALDREMARVGWDQMVEIGRIRAIRKTAEGRIAVVVSTSDEQRRRHHVISARFMHMSLGYPAIQLLPDLASYREQHGDRLRVVNAYEHHEPIYEQLRARGGLVVLRGRGIVASRILQRLWEERKANPEINVIHLHRSRLTEGHRYGRSRREVESEWEFQPFNWPKSCWTGEQREALEQASDARRKELMAVWGGTTTADRRDWRRIVQEGLRAGWYRPEYGIVRDVQPTADGRVMTKISNSLTGGGTLELTADFVIDCTGLVASPERAPVMADLISTYQIPANPLGRIAVSNDFEVVGMRHDDSRMYAAGATTLGGPHAAVDSFLGVQYAAYRAVDSMADELGRLHHLRGLYSIRQWLRWARAAQP